MDTIAYSTRYKHQGHEDTELLFWKLENGMLVFVCKVKFHGGGGPHARHDMSLVSIATTVNCSRNKVKLPSLGEGNGKLFQRALVT
jgi:hypothetical protein